ncbi:MAG: bifunctional ADP-heptose synthase [Gemmatimonadota bacterium]|nr:bifunctional ADP-heptose synthase [Gemmatimonadota bacterium]
MDRARFADLCTRFPRCRIVVLGDLMLDRYVAGPADRVSPEAPVPVVLVEREWDAVGGAGNVAANLRALGARCDVIGVVGDDGAGRRIGAALEEMGAGCHFVRDDGIPTTVKTRVLARGQQVVRVDREQSVSVSRAAADRVAGGVAARLSGAGALVVADYDKGVMGPGVIRSALDSAAAHGIPVVVDPKRRGFFAYGGATVFKPNRSELEGAFGEAVRPHDSGWMEAARKRLRCEHLLVTLGAEGMVLVSPGGATERARARAHAVYDVSGAGDTVCAVVSVGMSAGAAVAEVVGLAAHAAALGVAKVGVATVSPHEIADVLPVR